MRYLVEISYKGTNFSGWQRQPNANSVQEELEKALQILLRQPIEIIGSSRTDAGVHATQQFAHFDIENKLTDVSRFVHAFNSLLPYDIAIKHIEAIKPTVHARFDATYRCYEYRLVCNKNPFLIGLSTTVRYELDIEKMNEAAEFLLKYHDFECFSKTHTDVKTFLCDVDYAYWKPHQYGLNFYIKSNRFLRGMVRAIVGTLLKVGQNKITIAEFEQIILSKNRKNAAAQAPAEGLFLTEVGYNWEQIKATENNIGE